MIGFDVLKGPILSKWSYETLIFFSSQCRKKAPTQAYCHEFSGQMCLYTFWQENFPFSYTIMI